MKKTISEIISIVMFTAILAFVVASCQKDQNEDKGYERNLKVTTNVSDILAVLPFPICALIPDNLKIPEGNKFVLQTFTNGFQI